MREEQAKCETRMRRSRNKTLMRLRCDENEMKTRRGKDEDKTQTQDDIMSLQEVSQPARSKNETGTR